MIDWLKCLATGHDLRFERNIHGDEINLVGGRRSWYRCSKCGAWRARWPLYTGNE